MSPQASFGLAFSFQLFISVISALLFAEVAPAQTTTWQNNGTDFNTASNWLTSGVPGVPGPGNHVSLNNSGNRTLNVSANATVNGLYFNNASGYTISSSGGALSLLGTGNSVEVAAVGGSNNSGTNTISAPLNFAAASTQTIFQQAGGTLVLAGPITNATPTLSITGGGTVRLSGNNTGLTAATTLGANTTLQIGSNTALGSGTLSLAGSNTLIQSDGISSRTLANSLVIGAGATTATFGAGGNLSFGATTLAENRTFVVNNEVTTLSSLGQTASGYSLTKQGNGILVIAGNKTNTGGTAIQSGTFAVGGTFASGNVNVSGGGILGLNGDFTRSIGTTSARLQFTGSGGFAAYGTSATWGNAVNNLNVDIGNGSPLTIGTTNFLQSGQTLALGSSISNGTVTLQNNLDLNGGSQTIQVTQGATNIAGGSDATIAGNISNGAVVKTGNGTLTLTGANGYTGATTVSNGTLTVNGSLANTAVTVASGATLNGSGSLGGPVTVDGTLSGNGTTFAGAVTINGTHAVGTSPGLQTANGGLTYNSGSVFEWELIDNTVVGRGTAFDAVNGLGVLAFNGSTTSNLIFANPFVNWNNPFWGSNQSWTVFQGFSNITGTPFSTINVGVDGAGNSFGTGLTAGGSFAWSASGGNLLLNYTAVAIPEPSSILVLSLIGGLGLYRNRHRLRRGTCSSL